MTDHASLFLGQVMTIKMQGEAGLECAPCSFIFRVRCSRCIIGNNAISCNQLGFGKLLDSETLHTSISWRLLFFPLVLADACPIALL